MTKTRASERPLLLVGNPDPVHVGAHLARAAAGSGYHVRLVDVRRAYEAPGWRRRVDWWLRGRRPSRLRAFSQEVVDRCRESRPGWMLATGLAPVEASALDALRALGVQRVLYLTDDPWNSSHRAQWFMEALPLYDLVFSPRRANLSDLERLGCRAVGYLPFAYAPEVHYPDPPATPDEARAFASDVVFAGGADADRVPYIQALLRSRFEVALYGGYWERFPSTRLYSRGHADPASLRKAIGGAKVALCLVRRANRDGLAMRSFEVPAIGACMLVEDTQEHREIFGPPDRAVAYFRSLDEMVQRMRRLLDDPVERGRLASAAHRLIVGGGHTYRDRLRRMLEPAPEPVGTGAGPV
jgi:spore maturation protein CgeB